MGRATSRLRCANAVEVPPIEPDDEFNCAQSRTLSQLDSYRLAALSPIPESCADILATQVSPRDDSDASTILDWLYPLEKSPSKGSIPSSSPTLGHKHEPTNARLEQPMLPEYLLPTSTSLTCGCCKSTTDKGCNLSNDNNELCIKADKNNHTHQIVQTNLTDPRQLVNAHHHLFPPCWKQFRQRQPKLTSKSKSSELVSHKSNDVEHYQVSSVRANEFTGLIESKGKDSNCKQQDGPVMSERQLDEGSKRAHAFTRRKYPLGSAIKATKQATGFQLNQNQSKENKLNRAKRERIEREHLECSAGTHCESSLNTNKLPLPLPPSYCCCYQSERVANALIPSATATATETASSASGRHLLTAATICVCCATSKPDLSFDSEQSQRARDQSISVTSGGKPPPSTATQSLIEQERECHHHLCERAACLGKQEQPRRQSPSASVIDLACAKSFVANEPHDFCVCGPGLATSRQQEHKHKHVAKQTLGAGSTATDNHVASRGELENEFDKYLDTFASEFKSNKFESDERLSKDDSFKKSNSLNSAKIQEQLGEISFGHQNQEEKRRESPEPDWSRRMNWIGISDRFGRKMPHFSDDNNNNRNKKFWLRTRKSCCCNIILSTINSLFPILTAFRNYALPGDLITDLVAGFTIAVLHIPQGMAYGLLAGVEPIYGLYVSFVPVIIMSLMSKSLHVSYGTFAVISMLLASASDTARLVLREQVVTNSLKSLAEPSLQGRPGNLENVIGNGLLTATVGSGTDPQAPGLVLTNNHQPTDQSSQQLLKNLLADDDNNYEAAGKFVESSLRAQKTNTDEVIRRLVTASQEISIGSENLSSPLALVASSVNDFWNPNYGADFEFPTNIQILGTICLVVGLIQMFMALMRLGILSLMFSDQLVSSFTTASAVHVVTSQLSGVFDLTLEPVPDGLFKVCRIWWSVVAKLIEGFNQYTAVLSLFSLLFLLGIKEFIEPPLRRRFKSLTCLPSELALMAILIFASWYWQFESTYNIRIVGQVPTGLPAPEMPRLDIAPVVFQDALTIALVSFAMNLSLAQVYAKRFRYTLDPNQELFALGTSNFVSSFFSCYPCGSSLSRSAVQSNLNAKSPICSLFSCVIVVSIICYFAPVLHDLPRQSLSCIIIVALKGILIQVKDLYENWRLSKLDAVVWMVTFMAVIALGVTFGLLLGIVASLFMIFIRLLTPNHSILGQLPGTEIYVDKSAFVECNEIDQIKIFRFNSALCYLNRTKFKACVEKSLPSSLRQSQGFDFSCLNKHSALYNEYKNKIKFMIIDCSALAYCDYSGAATLIEIIEDLEDNKLNVYLAACPIKLINMFEKMQKTSVLERNVYPTITDAVNYAKFLRGHNLGSEINCPVTSGAATGSCSAQTQF